MALILRAVPRTAPGAVFVSSPLIGQDGMHAHLPTNRQSHDQFQQRCGLLLVLAFILHALAMAGGMHTTTLAQAREQLASVHDMIAGDVIAADQADVCWIVRPILPREGDSLALLSAAAAFLAFAHPVAAPAFGALRPAAPIGRPGQRRALFQVYRL